LHAAPSSQIFGFSMRFGSVSSSAASSPPSLISRVLSGVFGALAFLWAAFLRLPKRGKLLVVSAVAALALYAAYGRGGLIGASCAAPVLAPSQGKRVLVTGAAGFIGSHIARHAATELGMVVIGVDDMSGGFEYNVDPSFTFVKGDLRDPAFVRKLFKQHGPFEYVYHIAAYAAEGLSHFIRRYNYQTNLLASINVLNEAVKGGTTHFVFTSSIAVYGTGRTPLTEDMTPQPEDPYGVSKFAMELDLKAAHEMFGINFVVFRPHNVYGPGQNVADRYRNVIGIFMRQIMDGEPMTIFGDGEQTRAFSYISDVAPVIATAPLNPAATNQVFNVGADQPYTLKELASAVRVAMGVPNHEIKHLPPRNEVLHAHSDHTKLRCAFGVTKPPVTLAAGLAEMATWVLEQTKKQAFECVGSNPGGAPLAPIAHPPPPFPPRAGRLFFRTSRCPKTCPHRGSFPRAPSKTSPTQALPPHNPYTPPPNRAAAAAQAKSAKAAGGTAAGEQEAARE
jgi:UDP-glucose 4-epimerase